VAVLAPPLAWVIWWRLTPHPGTVIQPTLQHRLWFVATGVVRSFAGFAFGNYALGVALGLVFAATLVWRLRHGPRGAAAGLAWTAALITWWVGIAWSRNLYVAPSTFHYEMVGSVFVVLAAVPERPAPGWRGRLAQPALVGAAMLLAAMTVIGNASSITHQRDLDTATATAVRDDMAVALIAPPVMPASAPVDLGFVQFRSSHLRALVAAYGAPPGTRSNDPDASLLTKESLSWRLEGGVGGRCSPVRGSVVLPASDALRVRAVAGDVTVRLHRFGPRPRTIGLVPTGRTAAFVLPPWGSTAPWHLSAEGGCLVS
jgi:hypothetical protein